MKKNLRNSLLGVLGLVVVAIAVGVAMYFKPHKDFASSSPDLTLSAVQLVQRFSDDESAAIREMVAQDKTVLVKGTLREKATNPDGSITLVLAAGDEASVSCAMQPDQSGRANSLSAGSSVSIKGQCTGMQELIEKQVVMIRCAVAD